MSTEFSENSRVLRTAGWIWVVYWVALLSIDLYIYWGGGLDAILWYHLLNGFPAVIFLALAYSGWLKRNPRVFPIVMMLIISVTPILINHVLDVRLPPAPLANLEGMTLRQLPVLFIGLVLVAWHYKLRTMIVYSLGVNVLDLAVVAFLARLADPRMTNFYFITVIRTVCFIVVGIFINQLITYLRAQQESLKVANQQLAHYASTLESLTVSRERNRMSRELHDTVVHTLSGLSVQLETMKAYSGVDAETTRKLLDQSLETTRAGLQETRRALKALRASPLDDLGLVGALQKLTATAGERSKLQLTVTLPEPNLFLPLNMEQCVYRITQEAVENVIHHANAQHLAVTLTVTATELLLVIRDDGIGFDPNSPLPAGHFGLAGMRERAQLVGGGLTIESQLAAGTTIRLSIHGSYA